MNIRWSEFADRKVQEIFDYLGSVAGEKVARRIVRKIYIRPRILMRNPLAGPCEELLADRPEGFRYLVEERHKIVYFVEEKTIHIVDVFDCRRDPTRLRDGIGIITE